LLLSRRAGASRSRATVRSVAMFDMNAPVRYALLTLLERVDGERRRQGKRGGACRRVSSPRTACHARIEFAGGEGCHFYGRTGAIWCKRPLVESEARARCPRCIGARERLLIAARQKLCVRRRMQSVQQVLCRRWCNRQRPVEWEDRQRWRCRSGRGCACPLARMARRYCVSDYETRAFMASHSSGNLIRRVIARTVAV